MFPRGLTIKIALIRAWTIGWRWICLGLTALRYPRVFRRPAILLTHETAAQKAAYSHTPDAPQESRISRVLVVIPFRDRWDLTSQCIAALKSQHLQGLEVLVALVDNGSRERATLEGLAQLNRAERQPSQSLAFRHLTYDIPFNFSRLNNLAVKDCEDFRADYLCFLNNDVVAEDPKTLTAMASHLASHPNAASVGCTLIYPNRRIQHLCIAVGAKVVGAHPCKGASLDLSDAWFTTPRPVGAATAALLMVRRADFDRAQGFDERLATCYQDVDLALKFQAAGKVNWVLPRTVAVHHETSTRRPIHNWEEVRLMYKRWGTTLTQNPYFSPRWSRWSEHPALTLGEGSYPWDQLVP